MRRKAFTLIELPVVIAIIAILAAILFPVFWPSPAWNDGCARYWGEGAFAGQGRNACVPNYGFPIAAVDEPAGTISFADAMANWGGGSGPFDGWGYYLVFWRSGADYRGDPVCGSSWTTSAAASGNYAFPARWHNEGANTSFFDGHSKWHRTSYLIRPPAEFANDLAKWKLWYPLGRLSP